MMIVLEGTDCAGKSTLSKQLCESTGFKYLHYSKPDRHPIEYFGEAFDIACNGDGVICDRFIVGEKIYAKVKGTRSQWSQEEYSAALKFMNFLEAILVFVWEPVSVLKQRHKTRGETFVNVREMFLVQQLFETEIKRISKKYKNITCVKFNPSKGKLNSI